MSDVEKAVEISRINSTVTIDEIRFHAKETGSPCLPTPSRFPMMTASIFIMTGTGIFPGNQVTVLIPTMTPTKLKYSFSALR
ncbi:hypothetical protein BDY21DRAFT_381700 [Lineolata rhizophorae]|uniref:Uncharacterized protein n=1 Tax=Lineolata rhizophorae TaxID=578093 RepID=A0A6A6NQM1_9PEZI|nr:hypothetical protein BDY21DRAFT_381700 [Lineolata rhizophorae]